MNIIKLRENGASWPQVAEQFNISVDEAMQRYRDAKFDHWDTGWTLATTDANAHVETGAVSLWESGDSLVEIEEIHDDVPLTIRLDNGETKVIVDAPLSADAARELADTLHECADILEGVK